MTKLECNLPAVIEELQNKAVELEAMDVELQNQIDNEVAARTNADSQLQANIDAEIAARTAADETESNTRASKDQDLQSQIDELKKKGFVPAGAVQCFACTSAPEGWIIADGAEVSRTEYANLFVAIGTVFGAGDGSITFNLPDLRGEFIRGWDNSKGTDAGRSFGSLQLDDFKSHTHKKTTERMGSGGGTGRFWSTDTPSSSTFRTESVDYAGGVETRPRNIALLACIKY